MQERPPWFVPIDTVRYPTRRRTRLRGFDYRVQGPYMVTVVVEGRRPLFGALAGKHIALTPLGACAQRAIEALTLRRPGLRLIEHIVMPDHVHAILVLPPSPAEPRLQCVEPGSLSAVVGGLKAEVSRAAPVRLRPLWQRGFHDRIIRDERELADAVEYVRTNPQRLAARMSSPMSDRDT